MRGAVDAVGERRRGGEGQRPAAPPGATKAAMADGGRARRRRAAAAAGVSAAGRRQQLDTARRRGWSVGGEGRGAAAQRRKHGGRRVADGRTTRCWRGGGRCGLAATTHRIGAHRGDVWGPLLNTLVIYLICGFGLVAGAVMQLQSTERVGLLRTPGASLRTYDLSTATARPDVSVRGWRQEEGRGGVVGFVCRKTWYHVTLRSGDRGCHSLQHDLRCREHRDKSQGRVRAPFDLCARRRILVVVHMPVRLEGVRVG